MEVHIYDIDYEYHNPEIMELYHEIPSFEMSLAWLMNATKGNLRLL